MLASMNSIPYDAIVVHIDFDDDALVKQIQATLVEISIGRQLIQEGSLSAETRKLTAMCSLTKPSSEVMRRTAKIGEETPSHVKRPTNAGSSSCSFWLRSVCDDAQRRLRTLPMCRLRPAVVPAGIGPVASVTVEPLPAVCWSGIANSWLLRC